jgi:FKBP-type peptidyl-prolyl cis-trans isomerase FkpA
MPHLCANLKNKHMRKSLLGGILVIIILMTACNKDKVQTCPYTDPTVTVPAAEITALETYLASKNITNAVKDPRGFYYSISAPGTGATAELCSSISINYAGKLTNEVIFDQTSGTPRTFTLGELIAGWIKGIPLIKEGGRILLYLPPSLGYGVQPVGIIPANSILIFDIDLIRVL